MSAIGVAFVLSLALLHIFAGRVRLIEWVPERRWLSFGAGVSIAYVFVEALPKLSAGQDALAETVGTFAGRLDHHVYLVALLGLVVFYSLERLARRSREGNRQTSLDDCTSPSVFWVHAGAFALYNALLGYLLLETEHQSLLTCSFLFFALMLHFTVNDHALRSHHKDLHDRFGRWLLALAVIGGYLLGTVHLLDKSTIAVLWAFVAGGMILNVIKDELPEHREASLGAFLTGLGGYAALLVLVSH